MNEHEIDLALDGLGETYVRRVAPLALRQRVATVPDASEPQRRWLPGIPAGRFQSMFSATKFVVAGVILALFGGVLLTGFLASQPDEALVIVGASTSPRATATQPTDISAETSESRPVPQVELPAKIPAGVESGRLRTPVGPARWVHLSGDQASVLSPRDQVIATHDGYATLDRSGDGLALSRSPDLFTWTPQTGDLPTELGRLSYASDGTYWWLDGNQLWRSPDAASWEKLDLGSLTPPQREGFVYGLWVGRPVAHDGVVIVPSGWGPRWSLVTQGHALAERSYGISEVETGVYKLGHRMDEDVPTVRFEETEGGVRMIDYEDGTELKVIDGISLEYVEVLASDDGFPAIDAPLIIEGGAVELLDLSDEMRSAETLSYTTDGPGFTAYGLDDGHVAVHRSQDGRVWQQVATIGDDAGEPRSIDFVDTHDEPTNVQAARSSWTTADGLSWQMQPHGAAHRLGAGWIRGGNSFPWWYYPDGGEVVRIDHSTVGLPPKSECNGNPLPISSNTLRFSCVRDGARDTWLITFDDLAE